MDSSSHQSILITEDPTLLADVQRIGAASGADLVSLRVGQVTRGVWSTASLIVLGSDALAPVQLLGLPRRSGVVVVTRVAAAADALWPQAVAVGAEHVVELPTGEGWLIGRLGELVDGPSRCGAVVVVTSASGGAGVTTLACALASAAALAAERALLIDLDAVGGGVDLALGAEHAPGIRWGDLVDAQGRISAATLDYALPHVRDVAVLSHPRSTQVQVPDAAVDAVLDAARRGYDLVVCDHPRPIASRVFEAADAVVLMVLPTVRGVAAAAQGIRALESWGAQPQLVCRVTRRGLPIVDVRRALDGRSILEVPDQASLAERLDHGDPYVRTDAYGKAVDVVRDHLRPRARAA